MQSLEEHVFSITQSARRAGDPGVRLHVSDVDASEKARG